MRNAVWILVAIINMSWLAGDKPHAATREHRQHCELSWQQVLVATQSPLWDQHLDDHNRCLTMIQHALLEIAPFLQLTTNRQSRYFCVAKIPLIEYHKVKFADPYLNSALLIRLYLRVLVYDVEQQREVERITISGYQALPVNQWQKDSHWVLAQAALRNCLPQLADTLAAKLGMDKAMPAAEMTETRALQQALTVKSLPAFQKIPLSPDEVVPAETIPFRMPWEWIAGGMSLLAIVLAYVRLRHRQAINLDAGRPAAGKKSPRPAQIPDFVRRQKPGT